jgi:hypothetical protein
LKNLGEENSLSDGVVIVLFISFEREKNLLAMHKKIKEV